MGARLVIKFTDGDQDIAVTYQHWSAQTESALGTLEEIGTDFVSRKQLIDRLESIGMRPNRASDANRNTGLYAYGDKDDMENLWASGEMLLYVDLKTGLIDAYDMFNWCETEEELKEWMDWEDKDIAELSGVDFGRDDVTDVELDVLSTFVSKIDDGRWHRCPDGSFVSTSER